MSKKLEELKKLKLEFQEKAKKVFEEEFGELCKTVPNLSQVTWHQYTPYFNDGDACTFRVGECYFTLSNDDEDYEDQYDKSAWSLKYNKKIDEATYELLCSISSFVEDETMETVLLDMFGDHQEVTFDVASGEFSTEDYDHE